MQACGRWGRMGPAKLSPGYGSRPGRAGASGKGFGPSEAGARERDATVSSTAPAGCGRGRDGRDRGWRRGFGPGCDASVPEGSRERHGTVTEERRRTEVRRVPTGQGSAVSESSAMASFRTPQASWCSLSAHEAVFEHRRSFRGSKRSYGDQKEPRKELPWFEIPLWRAFRTTQGSAWLEIPVWREFPTTQGTPWFEIPL